MKLKITLAALAATALSANAASVIVDNYFTQQNGATGSAVGNWGKQSFTPTVAGLGANDTVAANSPLPATMYLKDVSFLKAVSGTGSTAGSLFVNVYSGATSGGTFLGSSTNSINVAGAAPLASLVWTFNNIALTSATEHAFVFSTTAVAGADAVARLQVARDSGGGFNNTYTGGSSAATGAGGSPQAYETRFAVTLDTVPEPSAAALLGLGGLAMILRRRK